MKFDEQGLHIHQSDLKNHCLEKLRLETVAVGPRVENDAATVGTVLHATIEEELERGEFPNIGEALGFAAHTYLTTLETYQAEGRPYALSSFNDHSRALQSLDSLVRAWYACEERATLLSATQEPMIEWQFDLLFDHFSVKKHGKKAEDIPVYLAGTSDIVWNNMVWDWKTSGSEFRVWEKQRWDRQPDVYTWAAAQAGLIQPDSDGLYRFDFKVFVRRAEPVMPQTVTVFRSANNWRWLHTMIGRLVNMTYNMGLDREWPVDDQHVLCSPKWCTFFDMCKGAHVAGDTWT